MRQQGWETSPPERAPFTPGDESRAVARPVRLRRELFRADLVASSLTGIVTAVAAGVSVGELIVLTLVIGLGWPVLGYLFGLHAREDLLAWASGIDEAPRVAATALVSSWPLYGLLVELGATHPAMGALVATGTTIVAVGTGRTIARIRLHAAPTLRERVVIVGSGEVARGLVARMRQHPEYGLNPIGLVDDDTHLASQIDVPDLGRLASLSSLLATGRVDRVVIAFTRGGHEQLLDCVRVCRDAGVPISVVPRLFEFLEGVHAIDELAGMPLVSFRAPAFSRIARVCKRGLDVSCAAALLLLLAPVLLAAAVAIRLDSPGPILFVQRRAGRDGRYFDLYKFRSMEVDAKVLVQESGAIVKGRDDERVTRVGRLIRRFSIDEAPQLFNVLRGDMSLVGPRPLVRAEQLALVEDWQARRSDLRPGLTGPWQVSGRSQIPFEDMIKIDYQYVAGWSLARDLRILLQTLPVVISGRGAF
jgi:exopolysaccharide biosynthesis polyprenyl glycosylphosphotransferase